MLEIMLLTTLIPLIHIMFNIPYYVINPNGTLNKTFNGTGSGSLTGFVSGVNGDEHGLIGWAMALIPFIIILVALFYALNDPFPAGLVASIVAGAISVIGTGIGSPPLVGNNELYLWMAMIIIFFIMTLIEGITKPYG